MVNYQLSNKYLFYKQVQWIQNEFTIEVYETHARIAIKNVSYEFQGKFDWFYCY